MMRISRFELADSMSFCSGSLSKLTEKLVKSKTKKKQKLEILSSVEDLCFKDGIFNEDCYGLALGKGIFPYYLVTSIEAMKRMKKFPPFGAFKEGQMGAPVTPWEYLRASRAYTKMGFTDLEQYYR